MAIIKDRHVRIIIMRPETRPHTIRSSTDCLIAAIAIRNGVPVWHRDRDYDVIAKFTALRATRMG